MHTPYIPHHHHTTPILCVSNGLAGQSEPGSTVWCVWWRVATTPRYREFSLMQSDAMLAVACTIKFCLANTGVYAKLTMLAIYFIVFSYFFLFAFIPSQGRPLAQETDPLWACENVTVPCVKWRQLGLRIQRRIGLWEVSSQRMLTST